MIDDCLHSYFDEGFGNKTFIKAKNKSDKNITNNDNMSVTITVIEKIIRPNTTGWTPPFRYAEYVY